MSLFGQKKMLSEFDKDLDLVRWHWNSFKKYSSGLKGQGVEIMVVEATSKATVEKTAPDNLSLEIKVIR